jgi:hypothetical protein
MKYSMPSASQSQTVVQLGNFTPGNEEPLPPGASLETTVRQSHKFSARSFPPRADENEEINVYFRDLLKRLRLEKVSMGSGVTFPDCEPQSARTADSTPNTRPSLALPRSKQAASKLTIDHKTLRELAVQASRQAIYISDKRRFWQGVGINCGSGILAVLLSFALLRCGTEIHELVAYGALVPFAISLLHFSRGLRMMVKLMRLMTSQGAKA